MGADNDRMKHHLAMALKSDETIESQYGTVPLHHHHAGDLIVSSGSIVACDPKSLEDEPQPFVERVDPGEYPVLLSIAHFHDGDQRVAYAVLRIRDLQPTYWTVAARVGDDALSGDDLGTHCYGVDSGKGCFIDAALVPVLIAQLNDEAVLAEMSIPPGFEEVIDEAFARNRVRGWSWANVSLEPALHGNMVAFTSGYGDGGYATYIGHNPDGGIACFVTDFSLFGEEA